MLVALLWLLGSASATLFVPDILTQHANSTLSEFSANTTVGSTIPHTNIDNYTKRCRDYFQSITDENIQPQCTENGAMLDQLIRFINHQFDQHPCGHQKSIAKHTEILYCSILHTHLACSLPLADVKNNVDMDVVPGVPAVERAVEELCWANHTLARDCLSKGFSKIKKCVKNDVLSIVKLQNEDWTYGALDVCRHFEVRTMCVWEELKTCDENTAKTMTVLIGSVLKPQQCSLSGAGRICCFKCLYFSVFIIAMILLF